MTSIPEPRSRSKVGLVIVTIAVVAITGMWVYAFGFAPRDGINVLKDTAWVANSEVVCKKALDTIRALPFSDPSVDTPEGMRRQSEGVAGGNAALRAMLDELRASTPTDAVGQKVIPQWLDDWDTYLAARVRYAEGLANGTENEFTEPLADKSPISNFIDDVARQNRMVSCTAPPLS